MKGMASFFPSPSTHNGQGHTACKQPVPRQSGTIILLMSQFVTDDKLEDISVEAFLKSTVLSHIYAHSTCSQCGGMKPDTTLDHGGLELPPEDGPASGLFAAVGV